MTSTFDNKTTLSNIEGDFKVSVHPSVFSEDATSPCANKLVTVANSFSSLSINPASASNVTFDNGTVTMTSKDDELHKLQGTVTEPSEGRHVILFDTMTQQFELRHVSFALNVSKSLKNIPTIPKHAVQKTIDSGKIAKPKTSMVSKLIKKENQLAKNRLDVRNAIAQLAKKEPSVKMQSKECCSATMIQEARETAIRVQPASPDTTFKPQIARKTVKKQEPLINDPIRDVVMIDSDPEASDEDSDDEDLLNDITESLTAQEDEDYKNKALLNGITEDLMSQEAGEDSDSEDEKLLNDITIGLMAQEVDDVSDEDSGDDEDLLNDITECLMEQEAGSDSESDDEDLLNGITESLIAQETQATIGGKQPRDEDKIEGGDESEEKSEEESENETETETEGGSEEENEDESEDEAEEEDESEEEWWGGVFVFRPFPFCDYIYY